LTKVFSFYQKEKFLSTLIVNNWDIGRNAGVPFFYRLYKLKNHKYFILHYFTLSLFHFAGGDKKSRWHLSQTPAVYTYK